MFVKFKINPFTRADGAVQSFIEIPIDLKFQLVDTTEQIEKEFIEIESQKAVNPILDYEIARFTPAFLTYNYVPDPVDDGEDGGGDVIVTCCYQYEVTNYSNRRVRINYTECTTNERKFLELGANSPNEILSNQVYLNCVVENSIESTQVEACLNANVDCVAIEKANFPCNQCNQAGGGDTGGGGTGGGRGRGPRIPTQSEISIANCDELQNIINLLNSQPYYDYYSNTTIQTERSLYFDTLDYAVNKFNIECVTVDSGGGDTLPPNQLPTADEILAMDCPTLSATISNLEANSDFYLNSNDTLLIRRYRFILQYAKNTYDSKCFTADGGGGTGGIGGEPTQQANLNRESLIESVSVAPANIGIDLGSEVTSRVPPPGDGTPVDIGPDGNPITPPTGGGGGTGGGGPTPPPPLPTNAALDALTCTDLQAKISDLEGISGIFIAWGDANLYYTYQMTLRYARDLYKNKCTPFGTAASTRDCFKTLLPTTNINVVTTGTTFWNSILNNPAKIQNITYRLNFINKLNVMGSTTSYNDIEFLDNDIKLNLNSFTESFLLLRFFDSDNVLVQNLITEIRVYNHYTYEFYDVNCKIKNSDKIPINLIINNPTVKDNLGYYQGYYLYTYRDEFKLNELKTLYMRASYFNAKTGKLLNMMTEGQPKPIDVLVNKLHTKFHVFKTNKGFYYVIDNFYSKNVLYTTSVDAKHLTDVNINLYQIQAI